MPATRAKKVETEARTPLETLTGDGARFQHIIDYYDQLWKWHPLKSPSFASKDGEMFIPLC